MKNLERLLSVLLAVVLLVIACCSAFTVNAESLNKFEVSTGDPYNGIEIGDTQFNFVIKFDVNQEYGFVGGEFTLNLPEEFELQEINAKYVKALDGVTPISSGLVSIATKGNAVRFIVDDAKQSCQSITFTVKLNIVAELTAGERYVISVSAADGAFKDDHSQNEEIKFSSLTSSLNIHAHAFDVVDNQDGTHTRSCNMCAYKASPEEHVFKSGGIITNPDCLNNGLRETICECGELGSNAAIPAIGHDIVTAEEKDATCSEAGWMAYEYCTRCDYTTKEEFYAEHVLVHVDAKEPTCTKAGYEAYDYCSKCDYTTYQEAPAKGHDLVHKAGKAPTCTKSGYETYEKCNNCNYTTYKSLPATGHNIVTVAAQAPTCGQVGWEEYEHCTNCDYTTKVELATTSHNFVDVPIKPVTDCSIDGMKAHQTCTGCDKLFVNGVEVHRADLVILAEHDLEKIEYKAATCTQDGVQAHEKCTRCQRTFIDGNEVMTVVIPAKHSLVQVDAKAPTCEEVGHNAYEYCEACDYTTYEEIKALGHTEGDVVVENNVDPTCTEKGSYDNVVYCTVCEAELSRKNVTVDENGHSLIYIDAKAPTCTEIGHNAYEYCAVCDYTTYEEIKALGHSEDDVVVENNIAPTCTEKGSYDNVVYCTVCDEELSRENVIVDVSGHSLVYVDAKTPTKKEIGWEAYEYCTVCNHTTYVEIPMITGTWKGSKSKGWWYEYSDGSYSIGWDEIDGAWYYFDAKGWMQTGWKQIGKTWYYFKSSGAMVTDWQKINNVWYYFDADGAMQTGWEEIDSVWYYFNASGAMQTGWQKISGTWYYFNSSGAMLTDWQKISGTWYYFNTSGAMQTGWVKLSGKWYYLSASGAMIANTSRNIGGKVYKFDSNGVCLNP